MPNLRARKVTTIPLKKKRGVQQLPQPMFKEVFYVPWQESSDDGNYIRRGGCSLHLNEKQYQQFMEKYNELIPNEVPEEYSLPALLKGKNGIKLKVSPTLYEQIKKRPFGLRLFEHKAQELSRNKQLIYPKKK
jgi:hypothetical protein